MADSQKKSNLSLMALGALGIVYGDIGTSPLYALKSSFVLTGLPVNEMNIIGTISLFIWLLILIVNYKYITIIMKCDQQGEGGALVLSSLCNKISPRLLKKEVLFLGFVAMALFAGDSVITPAISVLSAVEGLNLVTKMSENNIIITAIIILFLLFILQKQGSGILGKYFGYIMVIWFLVIGTFGVISIYSNNPKILYAINPYYAIKFLLNNGIIALVSLGGAILVITGVEALYADMGHFGQNAIEKTWKFFVLPALILNYLGQGSLLLSSPGAISNPFYLLAPNILLYPFIFLSVIATIIASQATISGIFSLTWQAIMLNYLPRMKVQHTSMDQKGQIYVPVINSILLILTISAVLIFKTSDSLASAYGLSVASVMLISTILSGLIAIHKWEWSLIKVSFIFIPFLCLDILFVISNLVKIFEGAWYTIVIAAIVSYIIFTWIKGNKVLESLKNRGRKDIKSYIADYIPKYNVRIPGCAIFMTRSESRIPYSLEVQLKHNKFLHEKIIFIIIDTVEVPKVELSKKFNYHEILQNIYLIEAKFGFYEEPNLQKIVSWAVSQDILQPKENTSFFLSRGVPYPREKGALMGFAEKLYVFLAKNSLSAYQFFKINNNKVVELGIRYKI